MLQIPFVRAMSVAQETKRLSELTARRCEQHFCGNVAAGKPQFHPQPMHDW